MVLVKDIQNVVEGLAPANLAQEWDNIGLVVGRASAKVSKVLLALDLLDSVIDEALSINANLIITHHPPFLSPIYKISDDSPLGNRLLRLMENNISLYVAHTNLDAADGGINDMLFDIFGLLDRECICEQANGAFLGRAGVLQVEHTVSRLSDLVQKKMNLPYAIYCGNGDEVVKKIAIVGGSAANESFFKGVRTAGCNVFITSDIKYHQAQKAIEMGINLIDATHFGSEAIFAKNLKAYIENKLSVECFVSEIDGQVFKNGG